MHLSVVLAVVGGTRVWEVVSLGTRSAVTNHRINFSRGGPVLAAPWAITTGKG